MPFPLPTEPEPDQWSCWVLNPPKVPKTGGTWTFEYGGTREECVRYIAEFGYGIRQWEISLRHPTEWGMP